MVPFPFDRSSVFLFGSSCLLFDSLTLLVGSVVAFFFCLFFVVLRSVFPYGLESVFFLLE
jgi:hypothetical protein